MAGPGKIARRTFLKIGAGAPLMASALSALHAEEAAKAPREGEGGRDRSAPVNIPYYSGRSDLDAGVACARMALGYFEPEEHFPYRDVAEMVCHREGFWTFEAQLIPILVQKGYRAVLQARTPYAALAAGKGRERYGAEAGRLIDRAALAWALPYLKEENFRERPAAFAEALEWLAAGDLVMLSVSRSVLRHDPSLDYCRCNVVLTGRDGGTARFHDPAAGPHRALAIGALRAAFEASGDRAALRVGLK